MLGTARPLRADEAKYGRRHGNDGKHDAAARDLAGAHQRPSCGEFPLALRREGLFRLLACLALVARITACLDDWAKHVVSQFHAPHIKTFLDA